MKIRLGGMGQCFFTWLLYSQYSINQAERGRLVRCWQGLNNFMGKIWLKEESSHDHLGLYGRIDPLTLGGSCWLWFSSSRQCCSLRRQERYSSLRLSNSECSSLHCVGAGGGGVAGEHHQGHQDSSVRDRAQVGERALCKLPCRSFGIFTSILPSQLFSELSVCLLTVSPSLFVMCSFK